MTDKDQCRTAFEEWADGICLPTHRTKIDPEYIDSMTHYAWQAWAHQSAELAARDAEIARLTQELTDERNVSGRLQGNAKLLINSLDIARSELNKEQRNKVAWGKEQIEGERDTNAILTDQLEKAEVEISRLTFQASDLTSLTRVLCRQLPHDNTIRQRVQDSLARRDLEAALSQPARAPAAQGEAVPDAVMRLIKAMRSQQTLGYFTNDYWQDLLLAAELAAAPKEPK